MKITVFLLRRIACLADNDRRCGGFYWICLHHQGDGGGSKLLWNVGQYLPDYTAQHSIRQPSSYSLLTTWYLRFVTMVTKSDHWTPPWANGVQFSLPHVISVRFILTSFPEAKTVQVNASPLQSPSRHRSKAHCKLKMCHQATLPDDAGRTNGQCCRTLREECGWLLHERVHVPSDHMLRSTHSHCPCAKLNFTVMATTWHSYE
jgi:hypothetical protein